MTDYEMLLEEIARRIKEPEQLKTMEEAFRYNSQKATIVGNVLSDFVLDLEDRENTFYDILKQQHIDINELLADVQKLLDEKTGVNLEPQTAPFPEERVRQAAHSLVDPTVNDETIQRRAKATAENITMSFSDDYMKSNAKFRSNAGLKCYITRITDGNCCKWCDGVAGRYEYGEEPQNVYRRHDNCGCVVTYENGRKRQDVWSKKSWETPETDKSEYKPEVLDYEQAKAVENENMRFKGVDKSGESGIIEFERAMAAKSFDKASEYARKKLKISISSLSELPLETVNAVNNSIGKLYKNVPSLFGIINEVLVDDINEIAKSSLRWIDGSPQIRLKLSRFYFANMSVEKIETIISELANDGVFTQKKGIYGIIQHEAVHLAEFKQTIKQYGGLRNDIEQSLDSFELAKELKELALHNCSLDDTDTIVISMLCSYATENPAEFLAEGYSSTVSNPLTDEIKRLLRKKWGM